MSNPEPLVLIVDDFADGRELLSDLLSLHGFTTVLAGSGLEALSVFDRCRPDAAIVDLGMPDMNGFELATRLRASQLDLPILAYSGYSGEDLERRARAAGCSGVVVKTTSSGVIVAALQAALRA